MTCQPSLLYRCSQSIAASQVLSSSLAPVAYARSADGACCQVYNWCVLLGVQLVLVARSTAGACC